jgi:Carbohydrate-binding family 9
MKQLHVPFFAVPGPREDLAAVSAFLDTCPFHPIDARPWPAWPATVRARFALAHNGDSLFLKFVVAEKYVRATYRHTNEPVYRDSCVEFFLAPGDRQHYYNLEFNCLGTCLVGYGTKVKAERHHLPANLIATIQRLALLKAGAADGLLAWELTVAIPREVFCYHPLPTLQGLKGSANFYKCGDDLPEPHFLAWNDIKAPAPDFHLPEFFGEILFG